MGPVPMTPDNWAVALGQKKPQTPVQAALALESALWGEAFKAANTSGSLFPEDQQDAISKPQNDSIKEMRVKMMAASAAMSSPMGLDRLMFEQASKR